MTPREGAARLRRMQASFPIAARKVDEDAAETAFGEAQEYSSGTLSFAEMRRLDHPYAKRHGGAAVPGDPAIINEHNGDFKSAWRRETVATLFGTAFRVVNDSKVAKWLKGGTKKMIARPIEQRIYERTNYDRAERMRAAIRRIFR